MVFFVLKFLIGRFYKKKSIENFCFDIKIENFGKQISCKAFLDSGNMLTDPLTKMPVSLINIKAFCELFDEIGIEDILTKSKKMEKLRLAHYITFDTLNHCDKIFVFQVERLSFENHVLEKPVLGLSLKNFDCAFETDVILHNNAINLGVV